MKQPRNTRKDGDNGEKSDEEKYMTIGKIDPVIKAIYDAPIDRERVKEIQKQRSENMVSKKYCLTKLKDGVY